MTSPRSSWPTAPSAPAPSRRRARLRHFALHGGAVAAVAGLAALGLYAIHASLARQGIGFSFAYLWRPSGINISEGLAPGWEDGRLSLTAAGAASSNAAMLLAGLFNSIKVALLAIVFSSVAGVLFGVARLSTNWLVRNGAFAVVEFVRNTPLLIQVVFWYFAVMMRLPAVTGAAHAYSWLIFGQSGVFLPAPQIADQAGPASSLLLGCGVAALAGACVRRVPSRVRVLLAACGIALIGGSVATGFPLALDWPVAGRFGPAGGMDLSPELSAILLAITINSAAYTAEIVRGAIESLPAGQWEAAAALGLSRASTLRDIVLPQVFRIVLPALGNRYISLTKDTSLGIAIGFPDLFNVSGTIANQTGRNLETVLIVMATYLLLSWTISLVMNLANARLGARS